MKTWISTSGWMSMSFPVRALVMLTWLVSMGAGAKEEDTDDGTPAMELLLFLGQWETDNGEWVDPADFEDDSFEQVVDPAEEDADE